MTKETHFDTINDGEIEYSLLRDEDIPEALEVLQKSFFLYENICIATDVDQPENTASVIELTELARRIAKDGISIVARHIPSGKLAGVALNKLHQHTDKEKKSSQERFLESFVDTTKTENVRCIMDTLEEVEKKFDIFAEWNIDCVVEHFMLSVLPEFGKRNIGLNLCSHSVRLAKDLGREDSQLNGADMLPKHLQHCRPKAIYAIFTSEFSHKIGTRLGFEDLAVIPYTEFTYKGVCFADKLNPIHKGCIFGAKKL